MTDLELILGEIQADINWRIAQICNIKTIPVRYKMPESHSSTIILYSIPTLYALYEGFLKNTFDLLSTYLSKKKIDYINIHINLLTHTVENRCNLGDGRKHFESKLKLVDELKNIIGSHISIPKVIPTESNVNYKVTNRILQRFNITALNECYEKPLNKFLLFRNKIAHGENSIKVTQTDIDSFSFLIQDIMHEIILKVQEYLQQKDYLTTISETKRGFSVPYRSM